MPLFSQTQTISSSRNSGDNRSRRKRRKKNAREYQLTEKYWDGQKVLTTSETGREEKKTIEWWELPTPNSGIRNSLQKQREEEGVPPETSFPKEMKGRGGRRFTPVKTALGKGETRNLRLALEGRGQVGRAFRFEERGVPRLCGVGGQERDLETGKEQNTKNRRGPRPRRKRRKKSVSKVWRPFSS